MDDDLQHLERELKRLRPAALSRELVARVARDLTATPSRRFLGEPRWSWALLLPAAAVAILAFAFFRSTELRRTLPVDASFETSAAALAAAVDTAALRPVMVENVLVAADDEGFVTLEDGTQARRERRQYVNTLTWKNPRTNASLTWTMPREEVRVVPIAFQ